MPEFEPDRPIRPMAIPPRDAYTIVCSAVAASQASAEFLAMLPRLDLSQLVGRLSTPSKWYLHQHYVEQKSAAAIAKEYGYDELLVVVLIFTAEEELRSHLMSSPAMREKEFVNSSI